MWCVWVLGPLKNPEGTLQRNSTLIVQAPKLTSLEALKAEKCRELHRPASTCSLRTEAGHVVTLFQLPVALPGDFLGRALTDVTLNSVGICVIISSLPPLLLPAALYSALKYRLGSSGGTKRGLNMSAKASLTGFRASSVKGESPHTLLQI